MAPGCTRTLLFAVAAVFTILRSRNVSLRGRIRLRDAGQGRTKVTFRLSYQAPGGIWGYIADRVAVRQVGRTTADTLKRLKRIAESGG